MASQAPLVSFVTPFYNTATYLAECIESVLRQTYENWEYILVDNCSTDGSSKLASQYLARFPDRIRVIRTESFLTQVQNYNFALSCISPASVYCKVVQADDWLFPDCARRMVEVAEAHPCVGIVAAYQLDGQEVSLCGLRYPSPETSGREVCRLYLLRGTYLFGTPTSLLIRSSIVRSRVPFYEERYWPFEDGHACFDLLKTSDFGFVHQVLTFTRRDNESTIILPLREFGFERFLHFSMLVAHGRDFLSAQEYAHRLQRVEREYFRFLAQNACKFKSRGKEFWDFHRRGLSSIGLTLDWRLLAKWMPRAFLDKLWERLWSLAD